MMAKINRPVKVPHIPTTAEMVEEQIEDVAVSTLELLDERLFYVFDKFSDYSAVEFAEFVKRGLNDFAERAVEKVKDWEGNGSEEELDEDE